MTLSRDTRKAQTRDALLRAAARLFARNGIEATSLDAIAAEVGLTKGAIYAHFENKKALMIAVSFAFQSEPSQIKLDALLLDETRPLRERFAEMAEIGESILETGVFGLTPREVALLDLEYFLYELRTMDPEMIALTRGAYEKWGKQLDEIQKKLHDPLTFPGQSTIPIGINLYRGLALAVVISPDLVPPSVFREAFTGIGELLTKPKPSRSGASRRKPRGG